MSVTTMVSGWTDPSRTEHAPSSNAQIPLDARVTSVVSPV